MSEENKLIRLEEWTPLVALKFEHGLICRAEKLPNVTYVGYSNADNRRLIQFETTKME